MLGACLDFTSVRSCLGVRNKHLTSLLPFLNFLPLRMASSSSYESRPTSGTCGLIVIGDEILKGQTRDVNTFYLAGRLKALGIHLERVSVIPDDVDIIGREIREFSRTYTYVLTSGGIGPTHDDVTFEGVARAFGDRLHRHPDLVDLVERWFDGSKGRPRSDAIYKLCDIPTGAKLNRCPNNSIELQFPLVSVENVYIFPGIPTLLRKGFEHVFSHLVDNTGTRTHVRQAYVAATEVEVVDTLNRLVDKYRDKATFGSYPEWSHNYCKTRIVVETEISELADQIVEEIRGCMPTAIVFDSHPEDDAMNKVERMLVASSDEKFKKKVHLSLDVLERCYNDYSPDEVLLAINGGKDCIVMVHLVHAYFQKNVLPSNQNAVIPAIYIREGKPFPEMEEWVDSAGQTYGLNVLTHSGPIKFALSKVVSSDGLRPNVKACVLGTRGIDPGASAQSHFSPTDGDWPEMMRVNPLLSWNYTDVWTFIRTLSLPYPSLYDRGYTSLGDVDNTHPNPYLEVTDKNGEKSFRPAYELNDPDLERAGRISRKTS